MHDVGNMCICYGSRIKDMCLLPHSKNYVLTAPGNVFINLSDARKTANCNIPGITKISENISRLFSFSKEDGFVTVVLF